MYYIYIGDP